MQCGAIQLLLLQLLALPKLQRTTALPAFEVYTTCVSSNILKLTVLQEIVYHSYFIKIIQGRGPKISLWIWSLVAAFAKTSRFCQAKVVGLGPPPLWNNSAK